VTTACPQCGEPVNGTDQFCEACGYQVGSGPAPEPLETSPEATGVSISTAPVAEAEPVRRCSCGGTIDADGWCTTCGLRGVTERDHFTEQPAPHVAAVCDRGKMHARNEDAVALAADDHRTVIVVCDGVTNSTDSDVASLAAARAARDVLVAAPEPHAGGPAAQIEHWAEQMDAAVAAAQNAATDAARQVGAVDDPPACTLVASVAAGPLVATAWVGDSRAYWLGDDGTATQLSTDDSWATSQVDQGVARSVAEADSRAHAITRWLGRDSPGGPPSYASMTVTSPGWLLVCSDGLWNYCSDAASIRDLVSASGGGAGEPMAIAEALVTWANEQGGHDNITAALARIPSETGGTDHGHLDH
jgi:serine/threonine protein phosphatase PrpC